MSGIDRVRPGLGEAIVGRAGELAVLDGLVAGAMAGAGAVALLEGPPGIGKSRLLEAAAELGAAQGLTVARGRADELDQISPWLTLTRAFGSTDPPILDRDGMQVVPGRLDQRGAVVEGFRESLERAAARRPVMVLLDDLQWADRATVAALGWLPEQLFSYPIVWVLARRPLPESSLLDALVARLDGLRARHLVLGPLDEAASVALAATVVGSPIGVDGGELLAATGGNPLFIVVVSQGDGRDQPLVPGLTERSLHDVVAVHLRSLSPPTVEVLRAASVLGREFSAGEVSDLVGRPSGQLLAGFGEAITGGVLHERSGQLAFGHDVFRQVLYSSIPGSVRRSMHAEAAAVLRRRGASATRLAHQLVIGAETGDPEAVASLYEALGELVGTSPWSAADLALRLVELTPAGTDDRATAVSMAVQVLGWAARTEEARELGERFLDSSVVPPVREAEILAGMLRAWLARSVHPFPRPIPASLVEDPSVPAGVRALLLTFGQAVDDLVRGDLERADVVLCEAAALLAGAATDLDAISVRSLWSLCAQLRGRFLVALERARADLQVRPTGTAAAIAYIEADVGMCLGGLGQIEEGLLTTERASQAAEESGWSHVSVHCLSLRAMFLLDAGRLEDARVESAVAGDAALRAGSRTFVALALATLVEASVRVGDLAGADAALERLLRDGEQESVNHDPYWATAVVAEARDRGRMALRALAPVFTALAAGNFAIVASHPARLPLMVHLALRHGEVEAARSVAAAAARLARLNNGVAVLDQVALHTRGLVDRDAAALREAYELSRTAETRLLSAMITEHVGVAEAEQGRRTEAVTALEEALALFAGMGAHLDAARVRAELRKLGVRKRHTASAARPQRGWAALTPAELSVVRVVGRGLTNRAAADELCVSADTVNTHLRHAFAKLSIRSRVELARLVATHER